MLVLTEIPSEGYQAITAILALIIVFLLIRLKNEISTTRFMIKTANALNVLIRKNKLNVWAIVDRKENTIRLVTENAVNILFGKGSAIIIPDESTEPNMPLDQDENPVIMAENILYYLSKTNTEFASYVPEVKTEAKGEIEKDNQ